MPANDGQNESNERMKSFSPREFLKARRPERFSDSAVVQQSSLDRSMLEYHLHTITSRSQEVEFEHFARRIAEKEICPNLLPHTGPTGGGDSKVDTETYPVADSLSLAWYSGIGREAAAERWAFAFSAKEKWREKVEADIAKIAATQRGYRKAFFISNQFIKDRTRAQVEDALREKYGLDVRLFDRSWLLDKVFGNGHQEIAIEELKLSSALRPQIKQGPMDLQKRSELEAVELRIKEFAARGGSSFQFVSDCIEAAELARGLELPQTEIEGRFMRAKRAADEHGTEHQKLLCAYQLAWTTYWWFEDFKAFPEQYEQVAKLAKGTINAYDLELLSNLWFGLCGAIRMGNLQQQDTNFPEKTRFLKEELARLKSQEDRPSASLQAEATELLVDLMVQLPGDPGPLLKQLQNVIQQSAGLVGFPIESFIEVLTDLGDVIGEHPDYEKLYELIVETIDTRTGEIASANVLVKRGAQKLDAKKPYDAIRFLGRALRKLYKHETREDVVRALYLCASAYDQVGLLWAARGTLLVAASVATSEFWSRNEVTPAQEACYNRLRWLEIKLGRLPHALAWHEVDFGIASVLREKGYDAKRFASNDVHFDIILGMLLLRCDLWELKHLSRLPDALTHLELFLSAAALRFALGYNADFPEQFMPKETLPEEVLRFMTKWRDQPAAEELPSKPLLYEARKVSLTSVILGCKITVDSDNSSPCVELSESILAALESLLATGMLHHVWAREPTLSITVRKSDFAEAPFSFDPKDREGRPHIEVSCTAFNPHTVTRQAQGEIKKKLFHLLANALARVLLIDNLEELLSKLFQDEQALERAIDFTSSFVTLGNVLGHDPKTTIDQWLDPKANDLKPKRSEEWDAADRRSKTAPELTKELKMGEGNPPDELGELDQAKHSDIEVLSLIREALWDRAGWSGTAFFLSPDGSEPPILAPFFKGAEAAGEIFKHWRTELGFKDEKDRLRLTVIRGVNCHKIHAYRVVIGVNPLAISSQPRPKRFAMISRRHIMEPTSDLNLRNFLEAYKNAGCYFLAHAIMPSAQDEPELVLENSILKRELHVRNAWEIGRNDLDVMGICDDDEPVIPKGTEKAPVIEVLNFMKQKPRKSK